MCAVPCAVCTACGWGATKLKPDVDWLDRAQKLGCMRFSQAVLFKLLPAADAAEGEGGWKDDIRPADGPDGATLCMLCWLPLLLRRLCRLGDIRKFGSQLVCCCCSCCCIEVTSVWSTGSAASVTGPGPEMAAEPTYTTQQYKHNAPTSAKL